MPSSFKNHSNSRSPSLSFLNALFSECISASSRKNKEKVRITGLKVSREILKNKVDEEGFAFVLLILTELISNGEVSHEIFEAIFIDLFEKFLENPKNGQKDKIGSFALSLSKILIYFFQTYQEAEYSEGIAKIVQSHLLPKILSLRARLIQFAYKICKYCQTDPNQIEVFKTVLKSMWMNDGHIKENRQNMNKFIIVCYKTSGVGRSGGPKATTEALLEVFGNEFYDAVDLLQQSDSATDEEREEIEGILSRSVLHRLISLKEFSKISLINGLRHPNSNIKIKSLELLLESDPKDLDNETILREFFSELENQYHPDTLNQFLRFPLREVTLNESHEAILFKKYLSIEDHTVRNHIKLVSGSNQNLRKRLEVLEVFLGKSKTFKSGSAEGGDFLEITNTILTHLHPDTEISYTNVANALLGTKSFSLFEQILHQLTTRNRKSAEPLFASFQMSFNLNLTSLNLKELAAGLMTVKLFRTISPEYHFEVKDSSNFLKMILILFFSVEYSIEIPLLEVISNLLSDMKDFDMNGIEHIDKNLLLLLLKGLKNDQLKNGHFLKILQTVRFAIKQTSGPGLQIYKQLLKKLIGYKFEFESGAFHQFEETDLKPVKDYLQDPKSAQSLFVQDFILFCLETPDYYLDLVEFIKILCKINFSSPLLPEFLSKALSKVDSTSKDRSKLVRSLFDLYLLSSTKRSPPFELHLSKHRSLLDTPFAYLSGKQKYEGYLELIELFMEANFKNTEAIGEITIEKNLLISLVKHIIEKNHEGLISACCVLLQNECSKDMQPLDIAAILVCYKLVYRALLNQKVKKEQTEISLLTTLNVIYRQLTSSEYTTKVKYVYERESINNGKTANIDFKLNFHNSSTTVQPGKNAESTVITIQTIEENNKTKVVATSDDFLQNDVYEYFFVKIEQCVQKLVNFKYERINEETNLDSMDHFVYLKKVIEYLLQTNKKMKPNIEKLIRIILTTFSKTIDEIKNRLRSERGKLGSKNNIQIERELEKTHTFMISKLHQEIDFILFKIMKIVSDQFGQKKINICSEILLYWMLLGEKHKSNSLLKLLSNFYKRAERKGLYDLNPLIDSEIHYISKFIRTVTKEIFGTQNTDVVMNLLITLFMFSTADQISSKKTDLPFQHFCHFLAMHMIDKTEDVIVNCNEIIQTLQQGISNLKGFLPSHLNKLKKKPKSKLIKDFLQRSDPFDGTSASNVEKIRGMRFCLIYQGFLNSSLNNKRLIKYIQTAIIQQNQDYRESQLMKKLEELMLETFKFDYEFEGIERGYHANVKNKKPQIENLFRKIKSSCSRNIKAISELIPIELYPLAITNRLLEEEQNFEMLLRLTDSLVDRITTSKISEDFIDFFSICIKRFSSLGVWLLESGDLKGEARQKFVQSVFVCLGQLHKKTPLKTEDIFNDNFETLLEIATKQTHPIVKLACLGSISLFSRNLNDQFIAFLEPFFHSFEKYILDYFSTDHSVNFDKLKSHKLILEFLKKEPRPSKKKQNQMEGIKKSSVQDMVKAWMKSFETVIKNMKNMVQPYIARMILYLGFIYENIPEQRNNAMKCLETILESIDQRNLIEPLKSMEDAISKKIFKIETTKLTTKSLDYILKHITKEDFADYQEKIFALAKESNPILTTRH